MANSRARGVAPRSTAIETGAKSTNSAVKAAAAPKERARSVAKALAAPGARLGARTEYRIYPSIGIARVGDSKDGFILAPEAPGIAPEGPYRGTDKGLKPQGARFRIFRIDIDANENERVASEVSASPTTKIKWSVSLANRKAAGFKIEDTLARKPNPQPRNKGFDRKKLVISAVGSIAGVSKPGKSLAGSITFSKAGTPTRKVSNIQLASLRTDDAGRLIVVGGPGKSGSPLNLPLPKFADNDGWYDSVSDGPVSATLEIGGAVQPVVPAWVVVTVPRFAPEIYGIVTWYDQAVSMARTNDDGTFNTPRTTSFTHDIYPVLKRADQLGWVHRPAHGSTGPRALSDPARLQDLQNAPKRAALLAKMSAWNSEAGGAQQLPLGTMPFLFSGSNPDPAGPTWAFPSLTRYQHAHFQNWVVGNFDSDWPGQEPPPTPFNQLNASSQPRALCEAALETCIGGSFFPGIEGTYDIARATTYHPESNLRREFRIDPAHPAGFLTEKMALPWQADFADCAAFWWPSQRPVFVNTEAGTGAQWDRGINGVTRDGHLNMVEFWSRLGLVLRNPATGAFSETERQPF